MVNKEISALIDEKDVHKINSRSYLFLYLRDWASVYEKMGKGVTLDADEIKQLKELLNNYRYIK